MNLSLFGNDPANWLAVRPFNGQPTLPVIDTQPGSFSVIAGGQATFSSMAHGSEPLRYQWYFNSTNIIPLASDSSLVISNAQLADAGDYHFVLANDLGSVTSRVARLTVGSAPVITNQPADVFTSPGGAANFVIGVLGSQPMSFKWFFNTNNFIPADTSYLNLYSIQPSQVGTYHVVVSNAYGVATSRFAQLTFGPIIEPGSLRITPNEISLSLSSSTGMTYELQYKNFLTDLNWITVQPPIIGTGSTITLHDTNTPFLDSRFYRVSSH
jgi:hypothetical protein